MSFELRYKDLGGRVGRLETRHGPIETPTLFPVINPFKTGLTLEEIKNAGFNAVITNAYIIWRRLGGRASDVHRLLGFEGPVMTDSGAYQILQYGDVEVGPGEIVEFQRRLGSDIAVILDIPTRLNADRSEAELGVHETIRRARMLEKREGDPLWVGPIQGGRFLDLVRLSAREMSKLGFDIYAVGSPTGLMEAYDFSTVLKMVLVARKVIGPEKPLHLFGAGHPMFIPFMAAVGVDLADSASYAIYASEGRYMTPHGTYRVDELAELPCSCPICSRYTARELRSLRGQERFRALALHNLYVLASELKRVRQSIMEGSLWELLEERSRVHPSLYNAFKVLKDEVRYLERYDPVRGPQVQGIFFYGDPVRPETLRHLERMVRRYPVWDDTTHVIFMPAPKEKPYSLSRVSRYLESFIRRLGLTGRVQVFFLGGPFIIVPYEISEFYPLSQHEGEAWSKALAIKTLRKLVRGLLGERRIVVIYNDLLRGVVRVFRGRGVVKIAIGSFREDDEYVEKLAAIEPVLREALLGYM